MSFHITSDEIYNFPSIPNADTAHVLADQLRAGAIPSFGTKMRLFVDMDGTLCKWKPAAEFEDLYEKGWFARMEENTSLVTAIKALYDADVFDIYILSAVLADSPYVIPEKNAWLDEHLPEIDAEHRIFVSTNIPKCDLVPGGIRPEDMLLDDYSKNLHEWIERGVAVKFLNGINGTSGTWESRRGEVVHGTSTPENIVSELCEIACRHTPNHFNTHAA